MIELLTPFLTARGPPDAVRSVVVSGHSTGRIHTLAGPFGLLVYQKYAWRGERGKRERENRIHFSD
jgi:hypothetical protein